MFENKCKRCSNRMVLDTLATATDYNKETTVLIDKDGEVTLDFLPNYVVLCCARCGFKIQRTFEDLIKDLKYSFVESLLKLRQLDSYKNLDREKLREESGISYCGLCPGPFDADGFCLNDLKSQCIVRKTCLTKKDE